MKCPRCTRVMPRSASFCGRCGYDLRILLTPRQSPPPQRRSGGGGIGGGIVCVIAIVAAMMLIGLFRATVRPVPPLSVSPLPAFRPPAIQRYPNSIRIPSPAPQASSANLIQIPPDVERVVFVCDASAKMTRPFNQIKAELRQAIQSLGQYQQFNLIFYQGDEATGVYEHLSLATSESKSRALGLIDRMHPARGSDPRVALEQAFRENPQSIYLITDGNFDETTPDAVLELCRAKNRNVTPWPARIDPVVILDNSGWKPIEVLRRLASESGGRPVFLPAR